jgi:hypothetical protein
MCIPCWPFTDVYLEEPPKKKDKGVLVWDPVSKTMVRLTGVISVSACFLRFGIYYLSLLCCRLEWKSSTSTTSCFGGIHFLSHAQSSKTSQLLLELDFQLSTQSTQNIYEINILVLCPVYQLDSCPRYGVVGVMVQEQNFQPQVGDTTSGPHTHTYIPRSDGSILLNGIAYVPRAASVAAAAVTVPVPIQAAVTVVQPMATPIATAPGGPSIVQLTPQHFSNYSNCSNYSNHPYSPSFYIPYYNPASLSVWRSSIVLNIPRQIETS